MKEGTKISSDKAKKERYKRGILKERWEKKEEKTNEKNERMEEWQRNLGSKLEDGK